MESVIVRKYENDARKKDKEITMLRATVKKLEVCIEAFLLHQLYTLMYDYWANVQKNWSAFSAVCVYILS